MTEHSNDDRGETTPPPAGRRQSGVMLAGVAFLVGLLVGGAAVAVVSRDDPTRIATSPSPSAAVQPSALEEPTADSPDRCVVEADQVEAVYKILDRAMAAARDLDAAGLQELVETAKTQRPQVEELVRRCREQVSLPVGTPTPTTSP